MKYQAATVRMNDEMFNKLKTLSDSEGRSLNKQIVYILSNWIKDYEAKNGSIHPAD